jgi:7-cyano-7-deazaguanine synthase
MDKCVLLLSGGLDSATIAGYVKDRYAVHAISFLYGQKHGLEIDNSRKIVAANKIKEHIVINLDPEVFKTSSLSKFSEIDVPKDSQNFNDIPTTYVPARNTIFLSYALAFSEAIGAQDIFIGVNALDFSGYPDCRPDFIDSFQKTANLATKIGRDGNFIKIHSPLLFLRKSEIIKFGLSLDVDYSLTHSCYDPIEQTIACGLCDSCRIRLDAFREVGIKDPIRYNNSL